MSAFLFYSLKTVYVRINLIGFFLIRITLWITDKRTRAIKTKKSNIWLIIFNLVLSQFDDESTDNTHPVKNNRIRFHSISNWELQSPQIRTANSFIHSFVETKQHSACERRRIDIVFWLSKTLYNRYHIRTYMNWKRRLTPAFGIENPSQSRHHRD